MIYETGVGEQNQGPVFDIINVDPMFDLQTIYAHKSFCKHVMTRVLQIFKLQGKDVNLLSRQKVASAPHSISIC
jgi:hypothetical protein